MILPAAFAALALVAVSPAVAVESADYGQAFVDSFAEACVPQRLSYPGTQTQAESLGWTPTQPGAHAELASMMAIAEAAASDPELPAEFDYRIFSRPIEGQTHYLVVSRAAFTIGEPDDPLNPWVYIGCYLYNLDATAPIDPAPVSALTGNPVANEVDEEGLVSYVWGPPCPMPRTGDTYLSFIAEDSPHVSLTGFSGLMMKFDTSEPDEGAEPPEPYC